MNEALKQKYKERSDKFKIYLSENTTADLLKTRNAWKCKIMQQKINRIS